MQEIADHAGVNKALLHYYFRSKADLARILQMMASDLSLDDNIDRFVDACYTAHAPPIRRAADDRHGSGRHS